MAGVLYFTIGNVLYQIFLANYFVACDSEAENKKDR
jgi:hypothetical protein